MATIMRMSGLSRTPGWAFEVCRRELQALQLKPVRQSQTRAFRPISCTYAPAGQRDYGSMDAESYPGSDTGSARRVFADFTVYKGKGAMTLKPIKPNFRNLDKGGIALAREGAILLEFANAVGNRQYDWNNKQTFALSIVEMGSLLSLNPQEGTEFVHDPLKGKDGEGSIIKKLKIAPTTDPRTNAEGLSFALTITANRAQQANMYVSVTKSEFAIMRTCITYVVPYFLGWHAFVDHNTIEPSMFEGHSSAPSQSYSNE